MSEESKKRTWPKVVATLIFIGLIGGGMYAWRLIYKPNVPAELNNEIIYIPTGSDFENVVSILNDDGLLLDESSFRLMAEQMNYKARSGRFRIEPNWTNRQLIRHLRGGKQAPINVILVNERLPEQVAGKVARFLESDSLAFLQLFQDKKYIESIGYSPETLMSLFIPNTYEFFWNTSPRKFMERMVKEHDRFWEKDNRRKKAEKMNLTPKEVYTLASIVGRETNQNVEKPRVAGLYYNRIKKGMLLQADPTLVFASKDWESRSLAKYKTLDSPYNTYKYAGLPPGPISMANISSIDAVLNHEEHKYIFMCAKGDGSGLHNFSRTLSGHNVNIKTYVRNLRKRGL